MKSNEIASYTLSDQGIREDDIKLQALTQLLHSMLGAQPGGWPNNHKQAS